MLSVTNISSTTFTAKHNRPQPKQMDDEIIDLYDLDEDSYEKTKKELEQQREELEEIADSKEFKLSKPINAAVKGGAIATTGILGGMASGWGAKKSITGLNKLAKTSAVKSVKTHIAATKKFIIDNSKILKTNFLNSQAYTMPANSIKKAYNKFSNSNFGKPVVKFLNTVGRGIKSIYNKISNGIKYVYDKIRGVKKETWEKATVNTVGVSGGIASGVTALKEQDKKDS